MPTQGLSLVIGASRGIGLDLCKQLKERGDAVLATCREITPRLEADYVVSGCDVSSEQGLKPLIDFLEASEVAVLKLFCVAGIMAKDGLGTLCNDRVGPWAKMDLMWQINAVAPLRVVTALLPFFREGTRIVVLGSKLSSTTELAQMNGGAAAIKTPPLYGYRMSKAALNSAMVALAADLKPAGISVALIHPGAVDTEMARSYGPNPDRISAEDSAKAILAREQAMTLAMSGSFIHAVTGEAVAW